QTGAPVAGAENTGWRLGVDYTTGPWYVGIAYHEQEAEAPAGGVDLKTEMTSVGARYTLGPGVTLYGGVQIWDVDGGVPAASGVPVVAFFGAVVQLYAGCVYDPGDVGPASPTFFFCRAVSAPRPATPDPPAPGGR